jgi:nucleoid-associated protein YgaU
VFDEDLYTARNGDTYRAISEQFYYTANYERALALYNRDNPYGPGGRLDPLSLGAGQVVRVPPVRVLERDYGRFIPNLSPVPAVTVPPTGATTVPGGYTGFVGGVSPVAGPASPGATSSGGYPMYRVRERGENLTEIARRTLGDSRGWEQIHRLNPQLHPGALIPAGTRIWLPPEARLPADDQP